MRREVNPNPLGHKRVTARSCLGSAPLNDGDPVPAVVTRVTGVTWDPGRWAYGSRARK